ncbi:MAG TPA: alpha/beta fold hydrolase [Candidatus Limnocylindria bacterium]|nr:alpha/beta fold hydrolase [Candidatus Limnocylindria bacterium]
MAVLSELRYPTTRLAKVFSGLLAIFLFAFVSVATISGFLLYQLLKPARTPSTVDLNVMMGHPTTFTFAIPGGPDREGWFFPGLRTAPTIVLAHGYLSQRVGLLTLVSALQDHQFNVFLFDFTGHGSSPGITTLGYHEARELEAALQALSKRDDVDPQHFGLWGVDMGAYAALKVAGTDPRVAAFAVDDAYDDPREMVQLEMKRSGLTILPLVSRFCDFGFRLMNFQFRSEMPASLSLARTRGVPKLFIQAEDRQALAAEAFQIFMRAPDPKQLERERLSYSEMADEDRHNYENLIVNFFLQSIPPATRP